MDIEIKGVFPAGEIRKLIERANSKKEKVWVSGSKGDFLSTMLDLWERGVIVVPGQNGPEAFCKFIYDNFSIPHKNNKQKELSLPSIQSAIYKLKK